MPTVPAAHEFYTGDQDAPAPPPGYVALYFKNGAMYQRNSAGVVQGVRSPCYAELPLYGEAVAGQVFGRYQPQIACLLTAVELSAQDAPTDAALQVELVNAANAVLATVSLPAGNNQVRVALNPAVALAADSTVRALVASVGSTDPGAWLQVRLHLQP